MGLGLTRFASLLCFGYLALSLVPVWGQIKADVPTITVYQTPT
jgi:hypothetical protein